MSAAKSWRCAAAAALALAVVTMLVGCADDSLPTCSDPTADGLVKQILINDVVAQSVLDHSGPAWLENVKKMTKIKLNMVRTTRTNERYGRRSCEAELQAQLMGNQRAVAVEYTIQQTDDKKNLLVQMTGHMPLAASVSIWAESPEFMRAFGDVPGSQRPPTAITTPMASSKPSQPAPAAPTSSTPSSPTAAGPVKTVSDVTLIWLECEDMCHLQYKTKQGELKSALCTETPFCQQWAENPPEFHKHIGAHATLKLGSQFVPEGGVTIDSVQGLEWSS